MPFRNRRHPKRSDALQGMPLLERVNPLLPLVVPQRVHRVFVRYESPIVAAIVDSKAAVYQGTTRQTCGRFSQYVRYAS